MRPLGEIGVGEGVGQTGRGIGIPIRVPDGDDLRVRYGARVEVPEEGVDRCRNTERRLDTLGDRVRLDDLDLGVQVRLGQSGVDRHEAGERVLKWKYEDLGLSCVRRRLSDRPPPRPQPDKQRQDRDQPPPRPQDRRVLPQIDDRLTDRWHPLAHSCREYIGTADPLGPTGQLAALSARFESMNWARALTERKLSVMTSSCGIVTPYCS